MSTDLTVAEVPVPSGVRFQVQGTTLVAQGPLGTIRRPFPSDAIDLATHDARATLTLRLPAHRKKSRALLRAWEAHLRNLAGGLSVGVEAKMKIVAAHFPMKVAVKGEELIIENFLGEKHPRTASLRAGTKAAVDGEFVILSGNDVEQVGQSAANIERATHIRDYDPRVFQDGIYLVEHAHLKEASG